MTLAYPTSGASGLASPAGGASAGDPVTVEVNGQALDDTVAPGGTAEVSAVDSEGDQIGTLDTATGVLTVTGKWVSKFEIDFSALETADLDHTAGTVAIGGVTWTQAGGATYLDDLDVVNGTGLVADMSAANSTFDTVAGTVWRLTAECDDAALFGADYDPAKTVALMVMCGALGNGNTEIQGILIGNDLGATDVAGALGVGFPGAGGVRRYRQQGTTVTNSGVAVTSNDCVMLVRLGGAWFPFHGLSSNGAWPSSWTAMGDFSANTAANVSSAFAAATDRLGIWAGTGNTSNNFAPVFRKLAGWMVDTETPE